jgi:hypothetical protein
MTPRSLSPEVTIWSDARHAPLAGELMNLMGSALKPIGVGGARTAEVNQLANDLDCERHDDLRKLLVDRPASFLLLTSLQGVTPSDLDTAAGQGTTVLTLEPIAEDLQSLSHWPQSGAAVSDTGRALLVPAFSHSPGFLNAAEPNELLGDRRTVTLSSAGRPEHGSLFARLLDAWQTVLGFTLIPETIDASLVGPLTEPPEGLREMTGGLSAHARVSGSCAALVYVSDTAGETDRALAVRGDLGVLKITDTTYSLTNPDGGLMDGEEGEARASSTVGGGFADLLAFQWRKLLNRSGFTGPSPQGQLQTEALACCLACLLSVRTGQPESPGKILQINR